MKGLRNMIISGPQGSGKSEFIQLLLEGKVASHNIAINPFKDKPCNSCEVFLFNEGVDSAHIEKIQQILKENGYRFRPAYAKKEITVRPIMIIETQDVDLLIPGFKKITISL